MDAFWCPIENIINIKKNNFVMLILADGKTTIIIIFTVFYGEELSFLNFVMFLIEIIS